MRHSSLLLSKVNFLKPFRAQGTASPCWHKQCKHSITLLNVHISAIAHVTVRSLKLMSTAQDIVHQYASCQVFKRIQMLDNHQLYNVIITAHAVVQPLCSPVAFCREQLATNCMQLVAEVLCCLCCRQPCQVSVNSVEIRKPVWMRSWCWGQSLHNIYQAEVRKG